MFFLYLWWCYFLPFHSLSAPNSFSALVFLPHSEGSCRKPRLALPPLPPLHSGFRPAKPFGFFFYFFNGHLFLCWESSPACSQRQRVHSNTSDWISTRERLLVDDFSRRFSGTPAAQLLNRFVLLRLGTGNSDNTGTITTETEMGARRQKLVMADSGGRGWGPSSDVEITADSDAFLPPL